MPEKFDFRKVEDQERFDKLPKEEREVLHNQDYDEAKLENEKIKQYEDILMYLGVIKFPDYPDYIHLPNAAKDLYKIGLYDLSHEVTNVLLKRVLVLAINCAKSCLDEKLSDEDVQEKIGEASIFHEVSQGVQCCEDVGLKNKACKILALFVGSIIEIYNKGYGYKHSGQASIFFEIAGAEDRMKQYKNEIERARDDNSLDDANRPFKWDRKLSTETARSFLDEIRNDSLLQIDDVGMLEEVGNQIEQKLAELKSK